MAITFGVNLSVDNYWDVPEFAWLAEARNDVSVHYPFVTLLGLQCCIGRGIIV